MHIMCELERGAFYSQFENAPYIHYMLLACNLINYHFLIKNYGLHVLQFVGRIMILVLM